MRHSYSLLLAGLLVCAGVVQAAEKTPLEKLCAGYERKQMMLQRRLKAGARHWEKESLRAQQSRIAADQARYCRPPAPAAAGATR